MSIKALFRTMFLGACPQCGALGMIAFLGKLKLQCSSCHLTLKAAVSGDGPAVAIIFILGIIVVPLILWGALVQDWGTGTILGVSVVVSLACSILLLRPLKGLIIYLHWRYQASDEQ